MARCARYIAAERPKKGRLSALGHHCAYQFFDTQDAHHALEVIGKHMKTHLGAHARQRLGQEVGPTHPVLDGSERMFHCLSSYPHHLGLTVQTILHRIEDGFVFPARDAPIVARGALRFERTPGAGRGPIFVQRLAVLDAAKALDSSLARGAAILIILGDVDKVALVEATLGLAV